MVIYSYMLCTFVIVIEKREAEEKAEEGNKEDSKQLKDKHKSDTAQPADKTPFLVTEKFLVDVLGVR